MLHICDITLKHPKIVLIVNCLNRDPEPILGSKKGFRVQHSSIYEIIKKLLLKKYNAMIVILHCKHPHVFISLYEVDLLSLFINICSSFYNFVNMIIFDTLRSVIIRLVGWRILDLWIWCQKKKRASYLILLNVLSNRGKFDNFCKFYDIFNEFILYNFEREWYKNSFSSKRCGPRTSCWRIQVVTYSKQFRLR